MNLRGISNTSLGFSGLFTLLIMGITCALAPTFCFGHSSPPEIVQGQRALFQMMGYANLKKADFYDHHPHGTPSDFVAFLDSEQGEVLWPPTTDHVWEEDSTTRVRDSSTGRVLRPESVEFVAHEVDPDLGRQLVFIPDDQEMRMTVECYDDPDGRPVNILQWDFPTNATEYDFD